jgi:hypothetical protein
MAFNIAVIYRSSVPNARRERREVEARATGL